MKNLIVFFLICVGTSVSAQDKPLFRFGVIADVQYADRDNLNSRYYRSSLEKLSNAVDTFNKEKISFVMSLGDFINDDFKSFEPLNAITARLQSPLYHVLGNHDFAVDSLKKTQVLEKLDLKKKYYSFDRDDWRFIVLNGNEVSLIMNPEGSSAYGLASDILKKLKNEDSPNAQTWNGTLGQRQIAWMKKQIQKAERKDQQVILFCHFPVSPDGSMYTLWDAKLIRNIIQVSPNVKAYFNGHTHKSDFYQEGGVDYVTFRGMVEKDENAFAIVSVFKDHLEIKGYGQEVDRILN